MTNRRRIAFTAAGALVLLLAFLAAVPLLFRDRVVARVKAQVDGSVEARVDWSSAGLTLVRSFPNLALRLDDLVVTGVDRFEGDTLVSVQRFRLVLDAWSVVRSVRGGEPIIVRSIDMTRPDVRLVVLEDGAANWDITGSDPAVDDRDARPLSLKLRKLEIRDGAFSMDNREAGLNASLVGVRQSLRGDFGASTFTIATRTHADAVSVRFAGVPYLAGVRLDIDADVDADLAAGRYTIRRNELRLNDLVLAVTGIVTTAADSVGIDVAFNSPRSEFAEILSLLPAIYTRDFATIQTSGTMSVAGNVRGGYGPDRFPALALRAQVENGTFRYPDLPLPAEGIFLDLSIENPGGDIDSTTVNLDRIRVVIGGEPVEGSFVMRTPVSDPDIAFRLTGRADLADVGRTIKLADVERMAGVVTADASMRARLSHLEERQYDRVSADGTVSVTQFVMAGSELPHDVFIEDALLRLTPQHAELASFNGRIGASDIALTGQLDNLVGFLLRDGDLRGQARLTSKVLDLNEWRSDDAARAIPVPGRIDFTLDAAVARLAFDELDIRDARGSLRVHDQRLTLDGFSMNMLGGAVAMTGYYETTQPDRPTFDMDLRMTELDVPSAFAGLGSVQAFAPVARYASGTVSADVRMTGALGLDMAPVYSGLTGRGTFEAMGLSLEGFPALAQLADVLKVEQLRSPSIEGVTSTFEIHDGRMHVRPFNVRMGEMGMHVSGSNGIDQTLQYTLVLDLPRSVLGAEANRAITGLVAQTARAGLDLQAAERVSMGVQLGGTVGNPSVTPEFRGTAGSALAGVEQGLRDEAARRVDSVEQRADSAAAEARRRAQEQAERLVAEAEQRAAAIRAEARVLAESVRTEGYEQADALVERASGPVARAAARTAADRLRRETDERANRIISEADARADQLVAEARRRADDGAGG
jgi:hypothetical protein